MKKIQKLIHDYGCIESEDRLTMRRKWLQIQIHSIIYYKLSDNIWSDAKWSQTAKELIILRDNNKGMIRSMPFSDDLRKFDGSSGFDLDCLIDDNMVSRAMHILNYHKQKGEMNNDRKRIRLNFKL